VRSREALVAALRECQREPGPAFLLAEVSPEEPQEFPRVPLAPEVIADHVRNWLARG
jgi:hypothetical protein